MAPLHTSTRPKVYSAAEYDAVCELLVRASARYAALKGQYDALDARVRAMQARSPLRRMQAHAEAHSAPTAPNVLEEVVKLHKARGMR